MLVMCAVHSFQSMGDEYDPEDVFDYYDGDIGGDSSVSFTCKLGYFVYLREFVRGSGHRLIY